MHKQLRNYNWLLLEQQLCAKHSWQWLLLKHVASTTACKAENATENDYCCCDSYKAAETQPKRNRNIDYCCSVAETVANTLQSCWNAVKNWLLLQDYVYWLSMQCGAAQQPIQITKLKWKSMQVPHAQQEHAELKSRDDSSVWSKQQNCMTSDQRCKTAKNQVWQHDCKHRKWLCTTVITCDGSHLAAAPSGNHRSSKPPLWFGGWAWWLKAANRKINHLKSAESSNRSNQLDAASGKQTTSGAVQMMQNFKQQHKDTTSTFNTATSP